IGQRERATQDRVIDLFTRELGYDYLGNWENRPNNSNIETSRLEAFLTRRGYGRQLITRALDKLTKAAAVGSGHDLYEANQEVYSLLRYGAQVSPGVGENKETVWLIDWANPDE